MENLKTINIKGKEYVEVSERLRYFRNSELYDGWSIETKIIDLKPDEIIMKATIKNPEGRIISTGTAHEVKSDNYNDVNSTSHIENCETSAVGRALGNLGIGINTAVASAEEVINAINRQEKMSKETKEQEIVWWDGVSPIKEFDHFEIDFGDSIETYKTMRNKKTGKLFGLNINESVGYDKKFYNFK